MSVHKLPDGSLVGQCDTCGETIALPETGRLPADWGSGQLWLDVTLADQRQVPLCFCPDCRPIVMAPDFNPLITQQEDI